ncbi:CPBP family intramembrane metalloprotease [Microcoleus sp. FACHB-1515]|uniref:CPBP family glutamic-type intramembrane protease n=1 Tax=Cyanophyceae TaxID=3028117 RepID=UPI001689844E|nr:CPBP family glutamic-type intramembrane protease [Microcoleus sp. FACHB-1515]MBD2092735.1 CPBP family intramembrane metalloprotease [Microcoleus sp. FACHB-1515]
MARWRKINWLIGLMLALALGLSRGSIATPVYSADYQPIAQWIGRLILPTSSQQASFPGDWVWLEVQHAPIADLNGQTVRLTWNSQPDTQAYLEAVTRNVRFTTATIDSQKRGNVHPDRLNGRNQVGALQSLAGARPEDSVTVMLDRPQVEAESGNVILRLDRDPIQVTGQFYGLVKLLEPVDRKPLPAACPGDPPCPSQFFRVQHFRASSGAFDGAIETIKLPQLPADHNGIFPSTNRDITKSPAGQAGWYIFGAKDQSGLFVVESIEPRSLVQLDPDRVIIGDASLSYARNSLWADLTKGTVQTTLLDPTATSEDEARSRWQEGDRALVLHVFGGIGGEKAEPLGVPNTITGHFAFGSGRIDRDPLSNQLRWRIEYEQVYAHNPNGIVSGSTLWQNYMGNLDRGWLGTRPVADILIRFDPVLEDYDFDGVRFSPLSEFLLQLRIMMARYRVGDGTGSATVTPATSCIQDSSQALFVAIARLKQQASDPRIQAWLAAHPDDEQTQRFEKLVAFGKAIEADLQPLGIVRADWDSAREQAAIAGVEDQPFRDPSIWAGLTTWRTLTPRQAQDELAIQFLRRNAALWIFRTNQVGGWDGSIAPLAPTALLGEITIPNTQISPATTLLNRLLASLSLPNWRDISIVAASLGIYAAIAIPIGLRHRLLRLESADLNSIEIGLLSLRVLFTPALFEELLFRVLFLPHPSTIIQEANWWLWGIASLIVFVLYHPLNAKTLYRAGASTFSNPTFLALAGLLGIVCTIAYRLTGSLFVIVVIHWAIVVLWLLYFGGLSRLQKPVHS